MYPPERFKIIIGAGLLPGKRANECGRKNEESAKTLFRRRILLPLPAKRQSDTIFVEEPDSRAMEFLTGRFLETRSLISSYLRMQIKYAY